MSACVPLRLPLGCAAAGPKPPRPSACSNISKEEYEARAAIVEGAYLYKGCAIATSDELDPAMSVVLPMAANDLLTINGMDSQLSRKSPKKAVSTSPTEAWVR
jgi:Predicted signaling protein consisting of a modified GGDEF domain and a DHH domain